MIGDDSRRCGLVGVASRSAHFIVVANFAAVYAFVFKSRTVLSTCGPVPPITMTFSATPVASVWVICQIIGERGLFNCRITGRVISFVRAT